MLADAAIEHAESAQLLENISHRLLERAERQRDALRMTIEALENEQIRLDAEIMRDLRYEYAETISEVQITRGVLNRRAHKRCQEAVRESVRLADEARRAAERMTTEMRRWRIVEGPGGRRYVPRELSVPTSNTPRGQTGSGEVANDNHAVKGLTKDDSGGG